MRALVFLLLAGCLSFHQGPLPDEPTGATFATVDGVRVRYLDIGTGPAVVLLHGFGTSYESWGPVIPALAKDHRVLALDLKGFGWTERPEGDYSLPTQAKLVLDLMTARGIATAAVVGQSWGGAVTLTVVAAAPERFTRVAIYGGLVFEDQISSFMHWAGMPGVGEAMFWLTWDPAVLEEHVSMAFYDKSLVTSAALDRLEANMQRPGATAAAHAVLEKLSVEKLEGQYATMTQPFLLVWGREDAISPMKYGERLAHTLPNAKLNIYPRCGHLPQIEAPRSTTDLVAFLEDHS
ncbi:MAG TPA: alpha/beta fold hydrolase [Kofleriaceae bacterium]|jgi:pimeloyl-ACP methyl ester carboxylesterase